jgi:DNA-binding MarR family transcriptional regulator
MSSSSGEGHQEAADEAWQAVFGFLFDGIGQRRFHEACDRTGLAPGVLKTLLQLRAEEPLAMRDLAVTFRCDPSYVTWLVDSLEAAGLAERQTHPGDRRLRVVALTDLGLVRQAEVNELLGHAPEPFASLSIEELRQLRQIFGKLRAAGDAEAQDPPEQARAATG